MLPRGFPLVFGWFLVRSVSRSCWREGTESRYAQRNHARDRGHALSHRPNGTGTLINRDRSVVCRRSRGGGTSKDRTACGIGQYPRRPGPDANRNLCRSGDADDQIPGFHLPPRAQKVAKYKPVRGPGRCLSRRVCTEVLPGSGRWRPGMPIAKPRVWLAHPPPPSGLAVRIDRWSRRLPERSGPRSSSGLHAIAPERGLHGAQR